MRSFSVLMIVWLCAFAETSTQSDWSGGPGVFGPVTEWLDTFYQTDGNVDYTSGDLKLAGMPLIPECHDIPKRQDYFYPYDIDGDGDTDFVGVRAQNTQVEWCENLNGSGLYWAGHVVDIQFPESHSVSLGDFDEDGDQDVVAASRAWNMVTCWENVDGSGTEWSEHVITNGYSGASCVTSGDIDGDGDIDVLASDDTYNICWWENSDTSPGISWSEEHVVDQTIYRPHWVSLDDINGDGNIDVIAVSRSYSGVAWLENSNGLGTNWQKHTVDGDFSASYHVCTSDIDGDGDVDIIATSENSANGLVWWANIDGVGTAWEKHQIASGKWTAAASDDIDNDGDQDIVSCSNDMNRIVFWENQDGTGTSMTQHLIDNDYDEASCVQIADMNGNGFVNPIGASSLQSSPAYMKWWSVVGYYPGSILSSVLDSNRLPEWDSITWDADEPDGTSIAIQLRSSNDHNNMGDWSDTLFSSGVSLENILADSTRFLQYSVILLSDEQHLLTPALNAISISYQELITFLEPSQYTIWTHGNTNQQIIWSYEPEVRCLQGDSVSLDLFKSDSLIASISNGYVPNTGQYLYEGPIPVTWEAGVDYTIAIADKLGNYGESEQFEVREGTGIEEQVNSTALLPFSPNPLSGNASVIYKLAESGVVELNIYDLSGRIVYTDTRTQTEGVHTVQPGMLSNGIYFCRLIAEGYVGNQMFIVVGQNRSR